MTYTYEHILNILSNHIGNPVWVYCGLNSQSLKLHGCCRGFQYPCERRTESNTTMRTQLTETQGTARSCPLHPEIRPSHSAPLVFSFGWPTGLSGISWSICHNPSTPSLGSMNHAHFSTCHPISMIPGRTLQCCSPSSATWDLVLHGAASGGGAVVVVARGRPLKVH